jgi:hypothetical protein
MGFWLQEHNALIQTVCGALSAILTVVSLALASVAVRLSRDALRLSSQQAELAKQSVLMSFWSQDLATRPVLDLVRMPGIQGERYILKNIGFGPAINLQVFYPPKADCAHPGPPLELDRHVLGVGEIVNVPYQIESVRIYGLTIAFNTSSSKASHTYNVQSIGASEKLYIAVRSQSTQEPQMNLH